MSELAIDFDLFLQNQGHNHPQAASILIAEYYAQVCSLMASLLPPQLDIGAASQAAMESISRSLAEYQPGTNFKIWLYTQVAAMAKSYWRGSRQARQPLTGGQSSLHKLILCLPRDYHFSIVLRYVHRLTVPEIAQILHMQPEKAREQLQQARDEIQALRQPGIFAYWALYHREYMELIAARLDNEISEERLADLNRHLAACSRCAGYLAKIEKLHISLQAELPALWPGVDIDESQLERAATRIMERMRQKDISIRSARNLKESSLYLIPAAGLILLVWMMNIFNTPEGMMATVNVAQSRSVNTTFPTSPNDPTLHVIRVLARRSPPVVSQGNVSDRANGDRVEESRWGFLRSLEGHTGWVNSVAYSADGRFLASGGADGVVRVWRTEDWSEFARLEGHTRPVSGVAFTPNGTYLATGGLDSLVRIWWLPGGLSHELECISGEILSLAISPDGRTLAVGVSSGVHLFGLSGRRFDPCGRTMFLQGAASTLAFSPNGHWIAAGSINHGKVRLYPMPFGNTIFELQAGQGRILALAFSPDGKLLATASENLDVNLWELNFAEGQIAVAYWDTFWHDELVKALAFSADGKLLATGSFDNAIRLWDIRRSELVQTLWRTRQDQVLSLAFAPDDNTLASGSVQGVVRLWGPSFQMERQPARTRYFSRYVGDTIGPLSTFVVRSLPIRDPKLHPFLSVSQAADTLAFNALVPRSEPPGFTPVNVFTWQAEPDISPILISNYIYATNYQPSYLTIRQGTEDNQVYSELIGATAIVEAVWVGAQIAEFVHGDWSVEDNSFSLASSLTTPGYRWDAENGSHWLRWKASDVYVSLEFHTPFSDRLIEEDERVTREMLLEVAESLIPLGVEP